MDFDLPADPSTAENYHLWRKDAVIWKKLTSLPREKQGLALQYTCKLNPSIQEAVLNIDTSIVECDQGFNNVLMVLDEYHNFNEEADLINTYEKFRKIVRADGQDICDFIAEFDNLKKKFESHGNTTVDHQMAHKLLRATKLTTTQMEIIKAVTVDFTYAYVKESLRRTFQNWTEISHPAANEEKDIEANVGPFPVHLSNPSSRDRNFLCGHQSNKSPKAKIFFEDVKKKEENSDTIYTRKTVQLKKNLWSPDVGSVNLTNSLHQGNCIQEENDIYSNLKNATINTHATRSSSTKFNGLVFMDIIKIHKDTLVLILMDTCTSYIEAAILNTIEPREIIENLFKYWVHIFGKPVKLTTYNDDLSSENFINFVASSSDIEICTYPKGGFNYSLGRIYEEITKKVDHMINETKCSIPFALTWVINGINCSKTTYKFSPSQLTFGLNLLLPSVRGNKPPNLSLQTYMDIVTQFLDSKRLARKTFIQTEISGLFRRSSNLNSPAVFSNQYFCGDKVLYKSPDDLNWHGPGIIIGHNEEFVLLIDDNTKIYTPKCCLMLFNKENCGTNSEHNSTSNLIEKESYIQENDYSQKVKQISSEVKDLANATYEKEAGGQICAPNDEIQLQPDIADKYKAEMFSFNADFCSNTGQELVENSSIQEVDNKLELNEFDDPKFVEVQLSKLLEVIVIFYIYWILVNDFLSFLTRRWLKYKNFIFGKLISRSMQPKFNNCRLQKMKVRALKPLKKEQHKLGVRKEICTFRPYQYYIKCANNQFLRKEAISLSLSWNMCFVQLQTIYVKRNPERIRQNR